VTKQKITEQHLDRILNVIVKEAIDVAQDQRYGTYATDEEILMRVAKQDKDKKESQKQDELEAELSRLNSSGGQAVKPKAVTEKDEEEGDKKEDKDKADDEEVLKKVEKSAKDEKEVDSAASKAAKAKEDAADAQGVSFTMIRDALNTIRAGRSLRDKNIRAELKTYVGQMDTEEKTALLAFLKGMGEILTAGMESSDVPDPSDPPYDIEMMQAKSEEKKEQEDAEDDKPGVVKKPVNRAKQRGMEDNSPPIQVGQQQQTEALRRKIRALMM